MTFAVIAYRQDWCVREAVQAAFDQTYSPLEIILSDDCSPDKTYDVLHELATSYTGKHTIVLNRTDRNSGIAGHINSIMRLAKGELVVISAGDDISLPERTERLVSAWLADGKRCDLLGSGFTQISKEGRVIGGGNGCKVSLLTPENMARFGQGIVGSTEAWTTRLWREWGDLPVDIVSEDQIMPFRAVLSGGIRGVPDRLVKYRLGVSTWIAVGPADLSEAQRRAAAMARLTLVTAQASRQDAIRAGRTDLLPLLNTRVQEAELLHRLNGEHVPRLGELIGGILNGVRPLVLLRALIKTNIPIVHATANVFRRLAVQTRRRLHEATDGRR